MLADIKLDGKTVTAEGDTVKIVDGCTVDLESGVLNLGQIQLLPYDFTYNGEKITGLKVVGKFTPTGPSTFHPGGAAPLTVDTTWIIAGNLLLLETTNYMHMIGTPVEFSYIEVGKAIRDLQARVNALESKNPH